MIIVDSVSTAMTQNVEYFDYTTLSPQYLDLELNHFQRKFPGKTSLPYDC